MLCLGLSCLSCGTFSDITVIEVEEFQPTQAERVRKHQSTHKTPIATATLTQRNSPVQVACSPTASLCHPEPLGNDVTPSSVPCRAWIDWHQVGVWRGRLWRMYCHGVELARGKSATQGSQRLPVPHVRSGGLPRGDR